MLNKNQCAKIASSVARNKINGEVTEFRLWRKVKNYPPENIFTFNVADEFGRMTDIVVAICSLNGDYFVIKN